MGSFPVPERLMHSVCLDVFAMPPVTWQEVEYDSILLCVDRLSGWLVACPTVKQGLTAERAAHLLLDKWWEPFGLPATVHSDMGPQFVGQWWKTMCARLGLHQTFSQPHRPRANGRAERAGQQLISLLRKLHLEHGLLWMEALPRALMIHHDLVGEAGLSPYQIMFGRDRPLAGIPYSPERECEDALEFFRRMERIDRMVSSHLGALHAQAVAAHNQGREKGLPSRWAPWYGC
jgi:transposase InsO family protein